MDFIEHWFGISPDGGSGTTELQIFLVAVIVISLLLYLRRRRRSVRTAIQTKAK